jgi:hypothetical protein
MNPALIIQYISDAFADAETVESDGNLFFFYNSDHNFPFATLVTNDNYDSVSNLSRPGVYRLNIGISRETYKSLFASQPAHAESAKDMNAKRDYSALDQLLPHPIYGQMFWVCILSPRDETFRTLKPLLSEAYNLAAKRHS